MNLFQFSPIASFSKTCTGLPIVDAVNYYNSNNSPQFLWYLILIHFFLCACFEIYYIYGEFKKIKNNNPLIQENIAWFFNSNSFVINILILYSSFIRTSCHIEYISCMIVNCYSFGGNTTQYDKIGDCYDVCPN